ncbi:MAG: hypothetical protein RL497_1696 [Pseudomonadota bacterium]|jgi:hypothetical protein
MKKSFISSATATIIFLVAQPSLAAQPKETFMEYKPASTTTKPAANTSVGACQIVIEGFRDNRMNQETIGTNFSVPLYSTGLDKWLSDAKADLWDKKIAGGTGKTIVVKPSLTRLYSYAQSMNIISVMAFQVAFDVNGKTIATKKYRANGSKTNMMNAAGEYYTALNYAAHAAMPLLLNDLPGICSSN